MMSLTASDCRDIAAGITRGRKLLETLTDKVGVSSGFDSFTKTIVFGDLNRNRVQTFRIQTITEPVTVRSIQIKVIERFRDRSPNMVVKFEDQILMDQDQSDLMQEGLFQMDCYESIGLGRLSLVLEVPPGYLREQGHLIVAVEYQK